METNCQVKHYSRHLEQSGSNDVKTKRVLMRAYYLLSIKVDSTRELGTSGCHRHVCQLQQGQQDAGSKTCSAVVGTRGQACLGGP